MGWGGVGWGGVGTQKKDPGFGCRENFSGRQVWEGGRGQRQAIM